MLASSCIHGPASWAYSWRLAMTAEVAEAGPLLRLREPHLPPEWRL